MKSKLLSLLTRSGLRSSPATARHYKYSVPVISTFSGPVSTIVGSSLRAHSIYACPAVPRKLNVVLISRLRKETQCTLSKAKNALTAIQAETHSGTDQEIYAAALEWLEKDMLENGAKKAAKVSDRVTAEGCVAVFSDALGRSAAIVEINSETDFVSKSELFCDLVQRVGQTIAQAPELQSTIDPLALLNKPLHTIDRSLALQATMHKKTAADVSTTMQTTFADTIFKLGENIQLRRALLALQPPPLSQPAANPLPANNANHELTQQRVFGIYAHAGADTLVAGLGKFAAIVALAPAEPQVTFNNVQASRIAEMAKKIAQHIVGFAPKAISCPAVVDGLLDSSEDQVTPDEALLTQDFLFGNGTVGQVLGSLSEEIGNQIIVQDFVRYACGEGIEKKQENFAEEVQRQANRS
ncbi:hypothetical protein BASA50_009512 [Batrachochytrium salamandrivorans]|uniref:Elongation factor Ts, mitochondrial n=1 Tax=Batrachochytrium salamandrivorans TaxID=1357716 RepID=A0ABQ8F182_9FUNG|nr:hypothetical protein BASA62_009835 [Batrachochytrium salamandrivorans]KAH6565158.1 hypothetical protein BASA60_010035 [Batrachochytrium salamandrivorans]KAH6585765.1 hypothetical protein BASA61_006748 [Batrachochytrium salamandrivorans]KAH6590252.1 hypothetical protein BASA50_009512 [Batrachochytrium salamandrivorans]KAH9251304.1 hypothetical protein BASA81_010858 [Batrachochytrium salamandrivorans]